MRAWRQRQPSYVSTSVDLSSPAGPPPRPTIGDMDSPFVRFLPAPSPCVEAASNVKAFAVEATSIENVSKQGGVRASKPAQKQQLAGGRSKLSQMGTSAEMLAALQELEDRGEEWGDVGWSREKELEHTRTIARKLKTASPPQPTKSLDLKNVFLGAGLPAAIKAPKACAAPEWEALPAGTRLSVWWEGTGESFECTILNWHVAVGADGRLFYTHRCEYEMGCFDHDLSKASFEVIEVAACNAMHTARYPGGALTVRLAAATPKMQLPDLKSSALNGSTPQYGHHYSELSPRRKWLAKQEKLLQVRRDLPRSPTRSPSLCSLP